jgi:hypothetical protein
MKLSPALCAELVELVSERTRRARVVITGTSMQPLLRKGMVVDIEPLTSPPRIGDILVFKSQSGLVAHRLVGGELLKLGSHNTVFANRLRNGESGEFITSGDAHPGRTEAVPPRLVVGRVCAVWTSGERDAQRVDTRRYAELGRLFARTRAVRSWVARARAYGSALFAVVFADPAEFVPPPAFSALVAATAHFERSEYAVGVARLCSVSRTSMIEIARRHHASGLIGGWLSEAAKAGVAVPADLRDAFDRIVWTSVLQAGRVLSCVRDVRERFAAAGVPHIFLKGGARLAADEPGAERQFSGDVDVIVPAEEADHALAVLRIAGYLDNTTEQWRASHASWLHHREPVVLPRIGVPVEVHLTLAPITLVSQRLDYKALAFSSRRVNGPIGEVTVLDAVASAVHLAYHARDLHSWRDIVLLARLLRLFDRVSRARFDVYINTEKHDALRLASAVAAADSIAFEGTVQAPAVKRYLTWATMREGLPRRFGYPHVAEALVGRCPIRELRIECARDGLAAWLRCWVRNLTSLPLIVRIARLQHLRNVAAVTSLLGDYAAEPLASTDGSPYDAAVGTGES